MTSTIEPSEQLTTLPISELRVGDQLINLGPVLEINELADSFSLVIDRMQERQVWRFNKDEELLISSDK
ncbi:hypothetical protein [Pedobacter frigoris]|uniref:Uncharacterized protein n=1 Tax=Pedobacter frigoris TaxID=2571272 RepID=A0A4U1CD09_9SPHI|nr:hypothetical protein [Pedobacter frigoris]TKC03896.1 hypothetical protein FA047_18250 [Pedobacter frigoris]